jgi:phage-related tail fiber protein
VINQDSKFTAILTHLGERKQAAAIAAGRPWVWTQMAVGDANGIDPEPDPAQLALINERHRAALNQVAITATRRQVILAELIIPASVGGWWIRETGLYDSDGDLVAVANCAPSYKSVIAQGTGKTHTLRMNIAIAGDANVMLMIDDTLVLATHQFVSEAIERATEQLQEQIAEPTGVAPGTFRQVEVDRRGLVVHGSNPTTLAGYEIDDAYTKTEAHRAFVRIGQGPGQQSNRLSLGWDGNQMLAAVDQAPLGNLWYSENFDPTAKADKATTYTKTQTEQRLSERLYRDSATHAGFAGNDVGWPYFRRESDGEVYFLQTRLGFAPVQQAGGPGQSNNKVYLGWNAAASALTCTVDASDLGPVWTDHQGVSRAINAQAQAGAGVPGSYALLLLGGNGAVINAGSLINGAQCFYASTDGGGWTGQTAPGTWRVMGSARNADGNGADSTTLCLRMA